jgi:predicted O-methyltransferase YrrM
MLMYDSNTYYIWSDIEQLRKQLLRDNQYVRVDDYGTGGNRPAQRSVSGIARTSLESPRNAQLLFRWLVFLSSAQPLNILELGTSLGITSAYLAAANSRNRLTTLEGSEQLLKIAQRNWQQLHLSNITAVKGNIDNTLFQLPQQQWDFVFIDANHTLDATLRYWNHLKRFAAEKSIFVFDDIHSSPQMSEAWRQIKNDNIVTSTFDIYHMGIVFFDKHYMLKHYRLRY